jgi:hypothetical protein
MLLRLCGPGLAIALTVVSSYAQTTNPIQAPRSQARDEVPVTAKPITPQQEDAINVAAVVEAARLDIKTLEAFGKGCDKAKSQRSQYRQHRVALSMAEDVGEWRAAVTNLRNSISIAATLASTNACGSDAVFAEGK